MKLNTESTALFSSSGELEQTNNALKSTLNSAPSIGLIADDTLILASIFSNSYKNLINSAKKTFILHSKLAITFTGLPADFRSILNEAINLVLQHEEIFGSEISVDLFTKKISSLIQKNTQKGGMRPYGVILLIGGILKKGSKEVLKMYKIDPSGSFESDNNFNINCKADYLKRKYSQDDGLVFVVKALKENIAFDSKDLSLIFFDKKVNEFKEIGNKQLEELMEDE